MSRAIAAVLRDIATERHVPDLLSYLPLTDEEFRYVWYLLGEDTNFWLLKNEERSAFLYLCSLAAEDEE